MTALNFTPDRLLCDPQGRPYFLWDLEMTLDAFLEALRSPGPDVRAYFAGSPQPNRMRRHSQTNKC